MTITRLVLIVMAVAKLAAGSAARRLTFRLASRVRPTSQQSVVCRLKRAEFALSSSVGQLIWRCYLALETAAMKSAT